MTRPSLVALLALTLGSSTLAAQGSESSDPIRGRQPGESQQTGFRVTRAIDGGVMRLSSSEVVIDVRGREQTLLFAPNVRLEVEKGSPLAGRTSLSLLDFAQAGLDVRALYDAEDGTITTLIARRPRTEKVKGTVVSVGADRRLRLAVKDGEEIVVQLTNETADKSKQPADFATLAEGTKVEITMRAVDKVAVELKRQ